MKQIRVKIQLFLLRNYLNGLAFFSELNAGQKTAEIIFTPRKGRLTDENRQTLSEAIWETLWLNNVKIQTYRWEGGKETVLLAHGWESNAARWEVLVNKLRKKGFTVVALDAPAHGESGSKHFNALLYAEMIEVAAKRFTPTAMVGHSAGAFATAFCAIHYLHPSVSRIVLLAPPSELNQIFDKFLDFVKVSPKVRYGFYKNLEQIVGKPIEYYSIKELIKPLAIKGLIIHDKTDDICAFSDSVYIHANWKGSIFIPTEGYGHRLQNEDVHSYVSDYLTKELS